MNAPTSAQTPPTKSRLFSLDALRGIAVFLMIEQHVGIWLWRGADSGKTAFDYPVLVGFNALGGGAAPLFVSLAGVGSALFVAASRPRTDITLVKRGVVLMGFGYLLNLLSPSWFSWGSWFVLHMMGFAMALGPVWRRLPNSVLLALCAAVLASTPFVQAWLRTPLLLENDRMRDVTMPGGPLRLALAEGQFPILPWLTFYLAGFVSGRWIASGRLRAIALLGAASISIGALGHLAFRLKMIPLPFAVARRAFDLRLSFFPATITIVTLLLGGALLLIATVAAIERRWSLRPNNPMVTLGRISLTLLLLHVPVFRDLSRYPWFEPWSDLRLWRGLSAPVTLAVIFGFFGLALVVSRYWQRVDFRFGAEWALRKLAG